MKRDKAMDAVIEQLKKTPIIHLACERAGIARASYYRWYKENKRFAEQADAALREGSMFISDLAESQLISAIKDKQLGAIALWLRAHHPSYANRLEINGKVQQENPALTREQKALIRKALRLAKLANEQKPMP